MKSRKLVLVAGIVAGMGLSVIAEPVLKDVKALFNPTIQYTLDGEKILEGKGALLVDGSVYMPLRDASTALGFGVDYQDKTVILTSTKEEAEEVEATEEDAAKEEVEATEEDAAKEEVEATEEDAAKEEVEVTEEDAAKEEVKATEEDAVKEEAK